MTIPGERIYLILAVILFGSLGLLMLFGAWHYSSDTRKFMKTALPTTGRIIAMNAKTSKDSNGRSTKAYYPVIEFSTREGAKSRYDSAQSVNPNEYPVGEDIEILYNRVDPGDARLDLFSDLWATTVVLSVMGFAFTGISVLVYFVFYRQVQPGAFFIPGAFALAVIVMYALAGCFGYDSIHLARYGEPAIGRIINVNPNIVEFRTTTGRTIKHNTNISSSPPDYVEGDSVPILYDPNAPKRAKINSFGDMWLFAVLWGGFGTLFLLVFIYCLYVRMNR